LDLSQKFLGNSESCNIQFIITVDQCANEIEVEGSFELTN